MKKSPSRSSSPARLRREGWCVIGNVTSIAEARGFCYDLNRMVTTMGMLAAGYVRNFTWRDRARELASGTVPPHWMNYLDEIGFYFRPAVINDHLGFGACLARPPVMEIVRAALGPNPCIASISNVVHERGTPASSWQPGGVLSAVPPGEPPGARASRPAHLVVHYIFWPFTRDNGGIAIVPRSHRRQPVLRNGQPRGVITVAAPLGSAIVCDGRLWSAVAANDDDFYRASLVVDYLPDLGAGKPKTARAAALRGIMPRMARAKWETLPADVKPLFRYWVGD